MILRNKRNKAVLADDCKPCLSIFSKARGLMFTSKKSRKSLLFDFFDEKRVSLHMFFVFYPIDVVYIDSENKVVFLFEDFKPFSFLNPHVKARYVLEMPSGAIKKANLRINDLILMD